MPSECIGVHSQKKIGCRVGEAEKFILDLRVLTNIRPFHVRYAQKLKTIKDLK